MKHQRCDRHTAECRRGADEKDRAKAGAAGDESKQRATRSQGEIEEGGVGSHGEPAAVGWHPQHGLRAETGIDQRITETVQCRADKRQQ